MEFLRDRSTVGRILLIFLLLALSGIAARQHALDTALERARQFSQKGNPEQAADQIRLAADLQPWRDDLRVQEAEYRRQAGDQALASGQAQEAVQEYQRVLALIGPDPDLMLALGDARLAAGDAAGAWQAWQGLALTTERSLRLADAFHAVQNYEVETQVLQAMLTRQPDDARTTYRLGLLLAAIQPDQTVPILQKAVQLDSTYREAALAIGAAVQLASPAQEPAYTHLMVGRALASFGEWELAAESFRRSVQIRTDYAEAWAFWGEARQHLPTPGMEAGTTSAQGLTELETAYKLDPNSISTNTFLAFYWERQQEPDKALPYLQTAIRLDPENPNLQVELGNLIVLQGDLPAAQAAYQKAIDLSPDSPIYWRVLAEFALKNDVQVRELGLPAARQAVTLAPDDPIGLDLLGQIFLRLGDQDSAQRFFRRALETSPQYLPVHLHLGMSYLLQGNLEAGRQELELVLSQSPDSLSAEQAKRLLNEYFP